VRPDGPILGRQIRGLQCYIITNTASVKWLILGCELPRFTGLGCFLAHGVSVTTVPRVHVLPNRSRSHTSLTLLFGYPRLPNSSFNRFSCWRKEEQPIRAAPIAQVGKLGLLLEDVLGQAFEPIEGTWLASRGNG
jgi:hypothetical protein